ncbi:MAG: phage phiEco32-like ligase-type 2 [Bacilli bacterium]|nr:phage phiEco32-like ligase-type 2 [Bacilli bacterium]
MQAYIDLMGAFALFFVLNGGVGRMKVFFLHSRQTNIDDLVNLLYIDHGIHLPKLTDDLTIISWGGVIEGDTQIVSQQILNPLKEVTRASHKKTMRKLLQLHGLKVEQPPIDLYHLEYQIPIFHLSALTVFAKKRSSKLWSALPFYETNADQFIEMDLTKRVNFYVRRAIREATKAVYALGLDFALVHIGISVKGRTTIIDVMPTPHLNPRLALLFADAIHKFTEEITHPLPFPIVLGADPEFILRKPNGKIVLAAKYMGREGAVGCDAVVLSGHRVILPLVELRPQPSSNPRTLVHFLRRTMHEAAQMIHDPQLEWISGGMPVQGLPLGGHIHFSGIGLSNRLLRVLDNYLALPLVLLEEENSSKRRPRYGFLGDFRRKAHGGFEYRSLPSWLISPSIALGVLSLASLIANHYKILQRQPLHDIETQRAYYKGDKLSILPIIYKLWDDIESTSTFALYHKELKPLRDMMLRMETWQEQEDFRKSWEIMPFRRKEAIL